MGRAAHLEDTRGLLIVNPRSGNGAPSEAELEHEAARRGLDVHVLSPGDDAQVVAREARGPIGVAGGDGSLGLVAEVALERDLPFVCIPFGTRNHFARDIGLDRNSRSPRWRRSTLAVTCGSTSGG
jgi:diacylglycerol kinase family enzyme